MPYLLTPSLCTGQGVLKKLAVSMSPWLILDATTYSPLKDYNQIVCVFITSLNKILDSTMSEGVRILNRKSANSGSKVFVSCVMIGSDKSLSSFQKRFIFSSLTGLGMLKSIKMGGRERKVIIISCMDYEAAAEDCGTQVI